MDTTRDKVFLTDASYKHTLSAIRSLGQKSLNVDVGSSFRLQLGAFSKYTNEAFVYPDPKLSPEEFVNFILGISKRNKYDVLIPIGYNSNVTLSKFKQKVEPIVKVPIADYKQLKVAAHKDLTIVLAKKLGIPVPDTIVLKEISSSEARAFTYPLVVKGTTESGRVHYASNPKELIRRFSLLHEVERKPLIIQEYIRGSAYGFFALFNQGEPKAIFMHKRIREYPITGGPSTIAESVYEPELKEHGLKILKALNWHGVAMIEFKRDVKDREFKLMEINPKFWGSLDLAIASGVDFPYLLYRMAAESDIHPVFNYKVGTKFMWPFPNDFLHVLDNPSAFFKFVKDLADRNIKKNVIFRDLKPIGVQLIETSILATHKLKNYTRFWYPRSVHHRV